jgi:hypothetical protein
VFDQQIISIDDDFVEAYNCRATANYGLRRVKECFQDLEQVLSRNPLHFGALCGKVGIIVQLMLLCVTVFNNVMYCLNLLRANGVI